MNSQEHVVNRIVARQRVCEIRSTWTLDQRKRRAHRAQVRQTRLWNTLLTSASDGNC